MPKQTGCWASISLGQRWLRYCRWVHGCCMPGPVRLAQAANSSLAAGVPLDQPGAANICRGPVAACFLGFDSAENFMEALHKLDCVVYLLE